MTISEAEQMAKMFDENKNPTEEEEFMFIEAMSFLINERKSPKDMMYLGGYYYGIKNYDLALKYYEMAAEMDYDDAYECLGYIWYYGRTGEEDYKKAFYYFSKMMDKGNLVATYKVADMYKNGYYVEKNINKYESIIEDLYFKVKKCRNVFDPIPEVYTRMARIFKERGELNESVNLYLYAKRVLSQRNAINPFFGNLSIMKWLIDDLYTSIDFDEEFFDFYDLFYLLKTPHIVSFAFQDTTMVVESVMEGKECTVCFNGKWFHNRDEFFAKASFGDTLLTALYDDLYDFEIVK